MTASSNLPADDSGRWTTRTVGMGVEILDRMERGVANVRAKVSKRISRPMCPKSA